jgi:hypothetical protein
MGEKRNAYMISVGNPEGKRQLARPSCTRVNNIQMDLNSIECGGMYWIDLAQNREQ